MMPSSLASAFSKPDLIPEFHGLRSHAGKFGGVVFRRRERRLVGNQAKHRATSGPAQLGLKRQASNGLNADQTTLKLVTEDFSLVAIAG